MSGRCDKGSSSRPHDIPCSSFSSLGSNEGLCLTAFRIFLDELGVKRKGWLSSTRELRLVSLQLCNGCRRTFPFRVWVEKKTPRSLWTASRDEDDRRGAAISSANRGRLPSRGRLLRIRAKSVVWDRSAKELSSSHFFLENAAHLRFGFHFDDPLQAVSNWPESLTGLDLGLRFQQDISGVEWPAKLRELRFGASFNGAIKGTRFPPRLRRLTFGAGFNKPIEGVSWPSSLISLEFGRSFDQPVEVGSVSWPQRLESLTFGAEFSHKLGGEVASVAVIRKWWPASLKRMTLLEGYRQPIDAVEWPGGLEELNLACISVLGCSISWPQKLKRLSVDFDFHQSIRDVPLPKALDELILGCNFNQAVDGVRWPLGLKRLFFGASFNQTIDGVNFPPGLTKLVFGCRFNQSVDRVEWPRDLKQLVFRDHFNQPISAVACWPKRLEELRFGWAFNQSLSSVSWPPQLTKLVLGKDFNQPVDDLILPPGLVEVEFAEGCMQSLMGVKWPRQLKSVKRVGRGKATLIGYELGLPKGCRFQLI